MQLHSLTPRHPKRNLPPVGRGGKRGKTSGRGGKGQTARAGHKIRPEMRDIIKKFPKRRGYGRNRSRTVRAERVFFLTVPLEALNAKFKAGDTITPPMIRRAGLVRGNGPIKVLGGTVDKAFALKNLSVSASAVKAVEAAGGKIHA